MKVARGLTLVEAIVLLGAAVLLAVILAPSFRPYDRTPGHLSACKSNLKNLATALEMYASDNRGDYPVSLDELTRKSIYGPYLKVIPSCPAAGTMTYRNYQFSDKPQCFSFACCGNHHGPAYASFKADSTNYPQYNAEQGLLDHP